MEDFVMIDKPEIQDDRELVLKEREERDTPLASA
jgi:hypothetical protein